MTCLTWEDIHTFQQKLQRVNVASQLSRKSTSSYFSESKLSYPFLGVDDLRDITVRSTGRQVKKRDIQLTDAMSDSVTVTLWAQKAEDFDKNSVGKVIRIRRAKVNEFNGKSLALNFSSSIETEPKNCPEAERLREWWTETNQNGAASFAR